MIRCLKVLWLPLLTVALAGCGGRGGSGGDAANSTNAVSGNVVTKAAPEGANSGRQLQIAMIPRSLDNPLYGYAHTGAKRAAKRLDNIEIRWLGTPQHDAAKQSAIVDSQVAQGVDGILISVADPRVLEPAINRAQAKGIPVVTFDSDAPTSKRVAYYGADDFRMGRRLGQEIGTLLKGKGRVAILSGTPNALNMIQRDKGVRGALVGFPNVRILKTYHCNDDPKSAAQIVSDTMRSKQPDGWVLLGNWPLMVPDGLNALRPGQTKVVAVDPLPATWKWIEKNYVQAALGQKVFGWGEVGIKLVVDAINKKPVKPVNDSGIDVVTPQTLGRYKKQWAQMREE